MSKATITGGQAFPRAGYDGPEGCGRPVEGMTLRDYFAAKALAGFLAAYAGAGVPDKFPSFDAVAHDAYSQSDAMLEVRNKQQ